MLPVSSGRWKLSPEYVMNSQYLNSIVWMVFKGIQSIFSEMRCVRALSTVYDVRKVLKE